MNVTETEEEKQFRRLLKDKGEQFVRDDLNYRRGISIGGETKLPFALHWLREKEREREACARQSDWYLRLTFWVAVATLVAAIVGVIATVLHP
jgi:hypothetical protein